MSYNFNYYGNEMSEALLPIFSTVIAVFLAVAVLGGVVKLVLYVIRSLSLHTISKRRGITNPWLSWIPVGQEWVIGSLSDQYKYLTQGKNQSRRTILIWLKLAALVLGGVSAGVGMTNVIGQVVAIGYGTLTEEAAMQIIAPLVISMVIGVVSFVVNVAAYVVCQMSMYDLYKSCDPKNAVVYEVFGILFGVTEPFFLLFCRNKDGGMPPRKASADESVSGTDSEV